MNTLRNLPESFKNFLLLVLIASLIVLGVRLAELQDQVTSIRVRCIELETELYPLVAGVA